MSKNKLISMKRINKDISEITKNPIKGIGIIQYEDDFMKYIVNIKILNGIYEGYCLQLLLTFSEYYPTKPPKIQIFPDQTFSQTYHHHIFDDVNGFKKFCFDLLENDFMNINEANTGWNPSYTISSLLMQVQNFLSDPDMSESHLPNKSQVKYLLDSMNNYVRTFVDENGNEIVHTWDYPYPPMFGVETKNNNEIIIVDKDKKDELINIGKEMNSNNEEDKSNNIITQSISLINSLFPNFLKGPFNNDKDDLNEDKKEGDEEKYNLENKNKNDEKKLNQIKEDDKILINNNILINSKINDEKNEEKKEKEKTIENEKKIEEIKENLSCFLLRVNIIDDKDIALGYPLKQLKALGNKIECVPIPEILSYEGYISQIAKQDGKLDDYFNVTFKAANNEYYNYWLPIYINEEHFQRNKILILNSFSVLKFGAKGQKEYDFKPEHIFEYLPNLLNKMICGMFNQKSYMSEAYIRCYFQYLLLFKKLIVEFKDEFYIYLNNIINDIKKNKYVINKKIVPDLGNLFMLIYFSDIELEKKMWNALFEEKMLRKMYWTFHFGDNANKSKSIFEEYANNTDMNKKILEILKTDNVYYYEYLEEFQKEKEYQPCIEEGLISLSNKNFEKTEVMEPRKGIFAKCKELGIFEEIVEIICKQIIKKPKNLNDIFKSKKKIKINDETKNQIKLRMIDEFPSIYKNECSSDAQKKIDQLLSKNIDLFNYCSLDFIEAKKLEKKDYFKTNDVDKLMKKIDKKYHLEITKKLYGISKSNLLLITTLAQMKINEPGFLNELEKNYGIFMKVEDFIQEINKKLKEIQCYKDLFNFMKADVIDKDEDEYERTIKVYETAKKKRYIQPSLSDIIKGLKLRNAKDFEKNNQKNNLKNNQKNKNSHKRTYHNGNNRNQRRNNNRINRGSNNNGNNNGIKKNNFNSHFVDLDEFLGE